MRDRRRRVASPQIDQDEVGIVSQALKCDLLAIGVTSNVRMVPLFARRVSGLRFQVLTSRPAGEFFRVRCPSRSSLRRLSRPNGILKSSNRRITPCGSFIRRISPQSRLDSAPVPRCNRFAVRSRLLYGPTCLARGPQPRVRRTHRSSRHAAAVPLARIAGVYGGALGSDRPAIPSGRD
jgi:hypothetical protein